MLAGGPIDVITGRVTDASLVVGPAVAHFGWGPDDLDALAGAVVAGHVIECGTQATGGNFAFFREIESLDHPGFPIAEIYSDGSSVITKHDGTDGAVTVETVTAQLLYEIGGHRYANPDVTARFDTASLEQVGADRVGRNFSNAAIELALASYPGFNITESSVKGCRRTTGSTRRPRPSESGCDHGASTSLRSFCD